MCLVRGAGTVKTRSPCKRNTYVRACVCVCGGGVVVVVCPSQ